MGQVIFSINVSLDGFIDHDAMLADAALHDFFTRLLGSAPVMLFGRNNYELMAEAWPPLKNDMSAPRHMRDFANQIDAIEKVVYSRTLDEVTMNNSRLAREVDPADIARLKEQGDVLVGGAGLADSLIQLDLIDRYILLVHPLILGKGVPLYRESTARRDLRLLGTQSLDSGVVVLDYERARG